MAPVGWRAAGVADGFFVGFSAVGRVGGFGGWGVFGKRGMCGCSLRMLAMEVASWRGIAPINKLKAAGLMSSSEPCSFIAWRHR